LFLATGASEISKLFEEMDLILFDVYFKSRFDLIGSYYFCSKFRWGRKICWFELENDPLIDFFFMIWDWDI
jgi:hypothetical protein